jgi:hypothetical protein
MSFILINTTKFEFSGEQGKGGVRGEAEEEDYRRRSTSRSPPNFRSNRPQTAEK